MTLELEDLRAVTVELPAADLLELRRVALARDDDSSVSGLIAELVHTGVNKLRETAP